ncbi:MAG TPA: hypothetical protein VM183_06440, partial [Burkholderiales bacterium]|nr:hypothetical protein [Burkholderiales bacterium]
LRDAGLIGGELERGPAVVAVNSHRVHWGRSRGNGIPHSETAQELDVAGTKGIYAHVEAIALNRLWRQADERHIQPGKRAYEACADRAAPDDHKIDPARVYNAFP